MKTKKSLLREFRVKKITFNSGKEQYRIQFRGLKWYNFKWKYTISTHPKIDSCILAINSFIESDNNRCIKKIEICEL